MRKLLPFILLFVIASLSSGCYYDNEEYLYGVCDTTNVSFVNDIKPIMDGKCAGCHAGGGIDLTNYAGVKAKVDDGTLYKSISYSYSGANSSKNMPAAGKLDDCTINKVKAWIDRGAPNN